MIYSKKAKLLTFSLLKRKSKQKEKNMLSKDIGRITIGNWNARSFSECNYQFEVVLAKRKADCEQSA